MTTKQPKKTGRPAMLEGATLIKAYLSAAHIAIATRIGHGNLSAGIRASIERADKSDRSKRVRAEKN